MGHADNIRLIGLKGGEPNVSSSTTQYVMTGIHYDSEIDQDVTIAIGFTVSTENMGSVVNMVDTDSMTSLKSGDAVVSHSSRNHMRFFESLDAIEIKGKHHSVGTDTTTIAV